MQPLPVSIPNPCHENWNEMTPQEQGRHCGKCCKTVIDFSSKTNQQILDILKQKQNERVCGRFNNAQLNPQPEITLTLAYNGMYMSHAHTFLVALLIVFGTTLFSCTDKNNRTVGKIEMVSVPQEKKYITMGMIIMPDTEKVKLFNPEEKIMGDTVCVKSIEGDIKGEVMIREEEEKFIPYAPELTNTPDMDTATTQITPTDSLENQQAYIPVDLEPLPLPVIEITTEAQWNEAVNQTTLGLTVLSVYPNPVKNSFNLKLTAPQPQTFNITLVDMSGKQVQQLYNNYQVAQGTQTLQLSINQPAGIYFVVVSNAANKVVQKIVVWN